jgi:hypothetical protein
MSTMEAEGKPVKHRHVQLVVSWSAMLSALVVVKVDGWSFPVAICLVCTAAQALLLVVASMRAGQAATPNRTTENGDSTEKFAKDLKARLLSGRFRTVKSFANSHTVTGLSRTTVYSAISGTRIPTEATVRNLLCAVADADDAEVCSWLERLSALDRGADPVVPHSSVVPTGRTRLVYVGLAVATAVVAVTLLVRQSGSPSAAPATSTSPQACTPLADLRTHQVSARVANTQGQGTFPRIQPQQNCHTGFLAEKDQVTVVCQDLHGPTVTDVYEGVVRDWSVWDKLASGAYVSDLYLDLPKNAQPALVAGLPSC